MKKEYDLATILPLPQHIIEKKVKDYHLVIAPEYPNWLVLDDLEFRLFTFLRYGTIRSALEHFFAKYCKNEKRCLDIMTSLLSQIDDVNFFNSAVIHQEEPVENIKKKVHITTSNGCNMNCMHCYLAAGTTPLQEIDVEKTIHLVNMLHEIYGPLEIVVSGGEPLVFSHLEKLLTAIKSNYLILFTNGSLIDNNNIRFISEYCNEVQISIESISREAYGAIRGEENYYPVLDALALLKKHNVRIVLAITVLPKTLEDIKDNLLNFIRAFNYKNMEIRLNDDIEMEGNALSMDMSDYCPEASKRALINLTRQLEDMGYAVGGAKERNINITNCGIGTNIVINYDGYVYPCHKFSEYRFSIETPVQRLIDNFNQINNATSNLNNEKCSSCDLRFICSGGCRIDNYKENGDYNIVSCNEEYKLKYYEQLIYDYWLYRER